MATVKDSVARILGTNVTERDRSGNEIKDGFLAQTLKATSFKTTLWNVRHARPGTPSPCGIWIDKVVVSADVKGADLGAALAPEAKGVDPSSSSTSRDVTVIAVDAEGTELGRKIYHQSLVQALHATETRDGMPVATELWLSMEEIDLTDPVLARMANRCTNDSGGGTR